MSPLFKKTPKKDDNDSGEGKSAGGIRGMLGMSEKGPSSASSEIEDFLGNLGRRIRVLEERYNNLRKQFQFSDQLMLKNKKNIHAEIKAMDLTLSEINKELVGIKDRAGQMSAEIKGCAKLSEFKLLEKYVDMWRPVNFLTREQAMKMIKEYAEKNK
ncbi:hypothetical protein KY335_05860 [Candidatus Woesearchaeota archaeon]|nr:hypothetical protein [Candidatus Woesearchaeota archaeon]